MNTKVTTAGAGVCPAWCVAGECQPPAGAGDTATLHRRTLGAVDGVTVQVVQAADVCSVDAPLLWLGGEELTAAGLEALWPGLVAARELLRVGE